MMRYFDWGWNVGSKPSRKNMVVEYHPKSTNCCHVVILVGHCNGAITLTETSTDKVVSVQNEHFCTISLYPLISVLRVGIRVGLCDHTARKKCMLKNTQTP